jgi:putative ABC transport system permease protein
MWRRYLRFWGPRAEADVDDELAFHIEMRARDYMARGMPEPEARRAATRRLGDLRAARAECIAITSRRERRMTRAQIVDAFVQDVRYAVRTLGRQKGWTAVAIATLALGIGANTAVFSVVNALLLRPLPYPNADRIAFVYLEPTEGNQTGMRVVVNPNAPQLRLWKENARSFEALEPYMVSDRAMRTTDGTIATVRAGSVLPSFASFTGARPVLGRSLTDADLVEGSQVAVLSEPFWRSRFGADSSILGKPITLDREPYTIVGIMPPSYRLPRLSETVSDVWLPLRLRDDVYGVSMIGRLRPNVTLATAAAELDSIYARSELSKGDHGDFRSRLRVPSEMVDFRDSLVLLSGAVGLVLLIACGNVAHLLLARTAGRQRELSIRAALGASRVRIVRQLLTESLLLGAAGCVGGIILGWIGLNALVALRPDSLPELMHARIDGTTLAATAGLAALTGLAVGALGALHAVRHATHDALKAGSLGLSQSRRQRRVRSLLVVSEMAVSTVLLVGATLLVRSIVHLQSIDPGFDAAGLYGVQISLPADTYKTPAARRVFVGQLAERARRASGIRAVTIASGAPPSRSFMIGALHIEGQPAPAPRATGFVDYNGVDPDFFRVMGIRLLEGTTLTDTTPSSRQAVVNAGFVRRYWPGGSAIGRRFRVVYDGTEEWNTVVGVVDDAATGGLTTEASTPIFYKAATEFHEPTILVRAAPGADPIAIVRSLVTQADPALSPPRVSNIETTMQRSIAGPRFTMTLLVVFTGLALVLAAIGLYGVLAFAVTQQTREIGIRMALGATRAGVARSVLRGGIVLAVAGVVIGLVGARWGTQLLEHMLYGVGRSDPVSFAIGGLVLIGTAVVACLVPMRRAVAVDPLVAIRAD